MLLRMRALTEAARALLYLASGNVDRARLGVEGAKTRVDLLTPLAKAYGTDVGCEVASIGVQVHGGMGFIEETGAAQHYRDARIAPIYEGTNGIQAADLVGRKMAGERGDGRVGPQHGGRQGQPRRCFDAVAQLEARERVEAQSLQRSVERDAGAWVAVLPVWCDEGSAPKGHSARLSPLCGLTLCAAGLAPIYVPLAHRYLGVPAQLAASEVFAAGAPLRGLLEDERVPKAVYGAKAA